MDHFQETQVHIPLSVNCTFLVFYICPRTKSGKYAFFQSPDVLAINKYHEFNFFAIPTLIGTIKVRHVDETLKINSIVETTL